jgi:abortive infection bacteriophage resistance protein
VTKSTFLALFSILSLTVKGKETNSKFPAASLNCVECRMKNDNKSVIDNRIRSYIYVIIYLTQRRSWEEVFVSSINTYVID